jgi:hypothetical protein
MRWWHRTVKKHGQTSSRVTVGMFDTSKGILVKCDCGKMWAL